MERWYEATVGYEDLQDRTWYPVVRRYDDSKEIFWQLDCATAKDQSVVMAALNLLRPRDNLDLELAAVLSGGRSRTPVSF